MNKNFIIVATPDKAPPEIGAEHDNEDMAIAEAERMSKKDNGVYEVWRRVAIIKATIEVRVERV